MSRGDVTLHGDTYFRLWNSIDSSMSDAVIDYTGSFTAYGAVDQQLLITDLDLINTLADVSYVEYATVTNSNRTGPAGLAYDINALDPSNVDNLGNTGWKFVNQLVINNSTFDHSSDAFALTTTSALEITESTHAHTSNEITLSSLETLDVADSTNDHTSELLNLSSGSELGIQDSNHAHSSDTIVLNTESTLVIVDSTDGHTSDEIGLIVNLAINDSTYTHESDLILLDSNTLTIENSQHGDSSDVILLSTVATLVMSESDHNHTSTNIVLQIGVVDLDTNDSTHAHTSTQLNLSSSSDLDVGDSSHAHSSETVDLAMVLGVVDSTHGHSSALISLQQEFQLQITSEVHAHTSDELTLSHVLQISNSQHAHTSDELAPTLFLTLPSTHAHTSDVLSLSTITTLVIEQSHHSHTSSLVILQTTQPPVYGDIRIYRDLQIIDRQVTVQPDYPIRTIGYFDIPDAFVVSLTKGTGYETGSHFGTQHFLRAPGVAPNTWYGSDPLAPFAVGPIYLQHAETTTKVSHTHTPVYHLDPVKVQEEEIGSTLPPVKVEKKPSRRLRRQ